MAKTPARRDASTSSLLRQKKYLIRRLSVPPDVLRASYVKQFLTCGKKNCRCRKGRKHGPFYYLVQCAGTGRVRKFLLKTEEERRRTRTGIAAYNLFQKRLEKLSQINTELLRRGKT